MFEEKRQFSGFRAAARKKKLLVKGFCWTYLWKYI